MYLFIYLRACFNSCLRKKYTWSFLKPKNSDLTIFFFHENVIYMCKPVVNLLLQMQATGCPKKHGNSVTNSISSLLWISIVIPNFKSHNIIMSARVYLMKRVKDCKDVSIMSPQDEQWIRTSLLCLYTVIFLFY